MLIRSTVVVAGLSLLTVAGAVLAQDTKAVERGKQVYDEQKCKMCHSVSGVGNAKGALDEVGGKHSPAVLKQWLTDAKGMAEKAAATRKPPMKSYSSLPASDLDALVAYLSTLKKK
jgi:cytochrome c